MVRNLAKKLGIDLFKIKGTGAGGRTTEEDVRGAAQSVKKDSKDRHGLIERVPIKGVRKAIARNLLLSQKNSAFVTGMDDADITELWNLKAREKPAPTKGHTPYSYAVFHKGGRARPHQSILISTRALTRRQRR